jgi:uncharacterized protein YkwD
MGKATVINYQGDGRYKIRLEYHRARIDAEIKSLTALIAQLSSSTDPIAKLRLTSATKRLNTLKSIDNQPLVEAWCADFTEDLQGTVGTAEIARCPNEGTIILPGYAGAANYDPARDGQMQHPIGNSPFAAYLNLCLFPAAQYHLPRYRSGEITSIEGDACDVLLDEHLLSAVPIKYMDCDGNAFEQGDRVLIKFRGAGWDSPQVIGFAASPKSCGGPCYITGQIVEIDWEYNDERVRFYIKDVERGWSGIRCIPSDWVQWQIGDIVRAINWHNCDAQNHCVDKNFIGQAGILFDLINQLREDHGLCPLYLNRKLNDAALTQAQWMVNVRAIYADHRGEDNNTYIDRIVASGYISREGVTDAELSHILGENAGFHADPEKLFDAWIHSPGHYQTLIRPAFEEMGIARVAVKEGNFFFDTTGVTHKVPADTYYIWVNTFGRHDPPHWVIAPY